MQGLTLPWASLKSEHIYAGGHVVQVSMQIDFLHLHLWYPCQIELIALEELLSDIRRWSN